MLWGSVAPTVGVGREKVLSKTPTSIEQNWLDSRLLEKMIPMHYKMTPKPLMMASCHRLWQASRFHVRAIFALYASARRCQSQHSRSVWSIFPPFGTCLVLGIQRAGQRRAPVGPPTATGSGRGRMDRSVSVDCHSPDRVMSAITP
jgi:hypothetical protein